jgi:hypothetical protein
LQHVHSMHPEFPLALCHRFVSILLSSDPDTMDVDQRPDPSYDTYLASWTKWAVEKWEGTSPELSDLRKEILSTLMKGIFNGPLPPKPSTSVPVIECWFLADGAPIGRWNC